MYTVYIFDYFSLCLLALLSTFRCCYGLNIKLPQESTLKSDLWGLSLGGNFQGIVGRRLHVVTVIDLVVLAVIINHNTINMTRC